MKRMTVFGSGLRIAAVVLPYFALTIIFSVMYEPIFKINFIAGDVMFVMGIILLIIGVSVDGAASGRMVRAFRNKELITDGLYSICANPMYASQLLLSIPGVALMMGSWLVLTTSLIGLITFKIFIKFEEDYLLQVYGQEYIDYRKKILIKFL